MQVLKGRMFRGVARIQPFKDTSKVLALSSESTREHKLPFHLIAIADPSSDYISHGNSSADANSMKNEHDAWLMT